MNIQSPYETRENIASLRHDKNKLNFMNEQLNRYSQIEAEDLTGWETSPRSKKQEYDSSTSHQQITDPEELVFQNIQTKSTRKRDARSQYTISGSNMSKIPLSSDTKPHHSLSFHRVHAPNNGYEHVQLYGNSDCQGVQVHHNSLLVRAASKRHLIAKNYLFGVQRHSRDDDQKLLHVQSHTQQAYSISNNFRLAAIFKQQIQPSAINRKITQNLLRENIYDKTKSGITLRDDQSQKIFQHDRSLSRDEIIKYVQDPSRKLFPSLQQQSIGRGGRLEEEEESAVTINAQSVEVFQSRYQSKTPQHQSLDTSGTRPFKATPRNSQVHSFLSSGMAQNELFLAMPEYSPLPQSPGHCVQQNGTANQQLLQDLNTKTDKKNIKSTHFIAQNHETEQLQRATQPQKILAASKTGIVSKFISISKLISQEQRHNQFENQHQPLKAGKRQVTQEVLPGLRAGKKLRNSPNSSLSVTIDDEIINQAKLRHAQILKKNDIYKQIDQKQQSPGRQNFEEEYFVAKQVAKKDKNSVDTLAVSSSIVVRGKADGSQQQQAAAVNQNNSSSNIREQAVVAAVEGQTCPLPRMQTRAVLCLRQADLQLFKTEGVNQQQQQQVTNGVLPLRRWAHDFERLRKSLRVGAIRQEFAK